MKNLRSVTVDVSAVICFLEVSQNEEFKTFKICQC